MLTIFINTVDGRKNLLKLVQSVGIKNKVVYFNKLEKKAPKAVRTMNNPTVIADVAHDFGFIFNDGLEIRHVSKPIFNYSTAEIVKKRERNSNV
jgi:hypothetical protein